MTENKELVERAKEIITVLEKSKLHPWNAYIVMRQLLEKLREAEEAMKWRPMSESLKDKAVLAGDIVMIPNDEMCSMRFIRWFSDKDSQVEGWFNEDCSQRVFVKDDDIWMLFPPFKPLPPEPSKDEKLARKVGAELMNIMPGITTDYAIEAAEAVINLIKE